MLHPHLVRWVLLNGLWFPVDGSSFTLDLEREWGTQTNTFAYGFSFCSGAYRLSGPRLD